MPHINADDQYLYHIIIFCPGPIVDNEHGFDLHSSEYVNILPGCRDYVQTDCAFAIPQVTIWYRLLFVILTVHLCHDMSLC